MNHYKIILGMLLVCLPFFCLCTGNVKVDDVTCLGEGKGGGSPILSKLDLGCCPGLKKIAGNMGVDAEGVCHPAIDGGFVCAKCGDGKCGIGENKCNCPSDCSAGCAPEGEAVFDNPGMGPVKCCDVDAGIKPSTRIDTTYNICSDPDRSGSRGICSVSWAKTCGNGVCDPGEDKCNCLQDCSPPECAKDGEQVYMRSIDGPVRCCNANSGIKYDHRLENGACTAVSGQFSPVGVCVAGWQKTCGDSACGSGENRCNCPQDCGKVAASCGNGKCEAGETTTNCLTDCPCVAEGRRMPTFAVSPEGFEEQRQTGNLECCPGLNSVSNLFYNGVCEGIVGVLGGAVCVKCGNGVCGSGENYCNCPEDCKLQAEDNITGGAEEKAKRKAEGYFNEGRNEHLLGRGSAIESEQKTHIDKAKQSYTSALKIYEELRESAIRQGDLKKEVEYEALSHTVMHRLSEVEKEKETIGGPCHYKDYSGRCNITRTEGSGVYFMFIPYGEMDLTGVYWAKKEIIEREHSTAASFLGLKCLQGAFTPTADDVIKCNVKPGIIYNCTLKLITNGTCSPMWYAFADQDSGYSVDTCDQKCRKYGYSSSYCRTTENDSRNTCETGDHELRELSSECVPSYENGVKTACCCKK